MLTSQLAGNGDAKHVKSDICFRLILKFRVIYHITQTSRTTFSHLRNSFFAYIS